MEARRLARNLARVTAGGRRCRIDGRRRVLLERTCVGLDVHARSVVGCAIDAEAGEIRTLRLPGKTEQIVEWVTSLPGPVAVTYEAGPTGFGLARALGSLGLRCEVVAPSKLERPPGDKVKTDRRDAERLARLLRIGELPAVRVPSEAEEAARDLVRAREDARGDLMRTASGLEAAAAPRPGVGPQRLDRRARAVAARAPLRASRGGAGLRRGLDAVLATHARRDRLDVAIAEMALEPEFAGPVGRLCCLRDVSTLTAVGLCVEVADWRRFTGSTIGAYLGLVPAEYSSATRRAQGSITKAGNGHARRLLVESAWHHRRPLRPSRARTRRADAQPPMVRERAEAGNRRLHQR